MIRFLPVRPPGMHPACSRIYVEAHGVHGPGGARVARRIERALDGRRGVLWARVNAPSSRVIVGVGDPPPRRATNAVLSLARDRRLEAVLAVQAEIAPGVDTVAATARDEGLRVLVADGQQRGRTSAPGPALPRSAPPPRRGRWPG